MSALDELLSNNSWEWEPEINNSNGHEPGYWVYVGDPSWREAAAELQALRASHAEAMQVIEDVNAWLTRNSFRTAHQRMMEDFLARAKELAKK